MLRALVSFFSLWFLLVSTDTRAQAIIVLEANSLKPTPAQRAIEVTEAIVWIRKARSWLGSDVEEGLLPGTYGVQLQSSTGVFFFGPDAAVYSSISGKPYVVFRGGVWFPTSPVERPRFFAVEDGAPRRGPTLAEAIKGTSTNSEYIPPGLALLSYWLVEANRGNVVLMQEVTDDAVASKLRAVFGQ